MSPLETVVEHTWPWPLWTAVIGLAILIVATILLYRSEPTSIASRWRVILLGVRIATCLVLIWMLGGWQQQQHRTEPAQLIVAIDDSASMSFVDEYREPRALNKLKGWQNSPKSGTSASAITRFDTAKKLLDNPQSTWLSALDKKYRIKLRLLGETVRVVESNGALNDIQPAQPTSKLGQNVSDLVAGQQGTPTAAIVIFSDGVTTAGPNLTEAAESARRNGIPLFIVGIGGDQPPRDLRLADLIADDVAFAGDAVQVEVQLIADGLKGQKTTVQLKRTDTGEVLAEQITDIDKDSLRSPIRLTFRPQVVGTLQLAVEATPIAGESDKSNNRVTHELHVNDLTIKVLYVQGYPSYEYRFLKNLLSRATRASDTSVKAFELTTILQEADREHAEQDESAAKIFPVKREELFAYDVVLFGDVDPALLGRTAIVDLVAFVREHGGSLLFSAGPRFTPYAYRETPLAELLPFDSSKAQAIAPPAAEPFVAKLSAVGALNPIYQLENNPSDNAATWNSLPALYWFVEIMSPNAASRVMLEHPTRKTSDGRQLPLVLHQYDGAGRVVFQATDETFRWARFHGSDEYHSRYWLQTLRSLSRQKLLSGQSPAEVSTDRQQYLPTEEVQIRVRFRDERSSDETVTVALEHGNGTRQSATLRRTAANSSLFSVAVRDLPSGTYRVLLRSPLLDPAPIPRTFSVAAAEQERIGVPLNIGEMQQAAKNSGGRYYNWFDADRLPRDLPRGQRVRIESLPPKPIWNSQLVAGLLVAMLTLEWILRRRNGLF